MHSKRGAHNLEVNTPQLPCRRRNANNTSGARDQGIRNVHTFHVVQGSRAPTGGSKFLRSLREASAKLPREGAFFSDADSMAKHSFHQTPFTNHEVHCSSLSSFFWGGETHGMKYGNCDKMLIPGDMGWCFPAPISLRITHAKPVSSPVVYAAFCKKSYGEKHGIGSLFLVLGGSGCLGLGLG